MEVEVEVGLGDIIDEVKEDVGWWWGGVCG